jgi:DNA-binding MarR family transcriptional regulator
MAPLLMGRPSPTVSTDPALGPARFDSRLSLCHSPDILLERTPEGQLATAVILGTFRANGLLLAAGDELTATTGLTPARWQVLGALALAERPLTVPQIARRMGLTRQSVHATVGRLLAAGLLELAPNADHRRSQLVAMTPAGREAYRALDRRQAAWVNELADGLRRDELESAARVLEALCRRLEQADGDGKE